MALYDYMDYGVGYDPDEEERKRRQLEQEAIAQRMDIEAYNNPALQEQSLGFGDIASRAFDNRMNVAQNRMNQASAMFNDPQEALRRRLATQQDEAAAEPTPVKQTITTNPQTGEQTMKIEGSARDLSAANPLTPTVIGPVAPTEEQLRPQQEQFAQQFQQYRQRPVDNQQPPVAMQRQMPPPGSISPEMANRQMPNIGMPPTPGPGVQVASNQANLPPTVSANAPRPAVPGLAALPTLAQMGMAAQQAQANRVAQGQGEGGANTEDIYREAIINGANEKDPAKRRNSFATIIADPNAGEGNKALAQNFMFDDYKKQKGIDEANEKLAEATPTDYARYLKEKNKEGSYIKAILLARLGLNDLAQKEMELINPTITMGSAVDSKGQKFSAGRDKNGNIIVGFDANGKKIGQEKLAELSAAAMPTKSFLLPQGAGGLMQKTIIGPDGQPQVITGQVFTDPVTQDTYFQSGKTRYDPTGLSTPAQNVQNVYSAAAAGSAGKLGGEGLIPQPLPAFPGQQGGAPASYVNPQQAATTTVATTPVDPAAISRAQRDLVALQNTINTIPANDPKREERLRILNAEVATKQGILQKANQIPISVNQPLWKQKQQAELGTEQGKANIQLNKEVAAAELKPPAEQKGKVEAKEIAAQDFSDKTYKIIRPISDAIKQSTGSGIGAITDDALSLFGKGTTGSANIAKLNALSYQIISQIPRMEGAQSNIDVEMYKQAAGDLANRKAPVSDRLAALQTIITMMEIHDRDKKNDWSAFTQGPQNTGQSSTGVKWKVK